MAGIKSTRTLGYSLKGILDLEMMTITEVSEEEEVVHDLKEKIEKFDGQEITISISNKVKLEDGVE
jgi:YonK protein